MMRGLRRGVMLLATGAIVGGTAAAQAPSRLPPGAVVQPLEDPNGAELRRHLQTLADNPRSLDALVGAGRAALRAGDSDAALSFFGRANEIAPRDARVKAGIASAMVQMGEARSALALFAEALSLGAPEAEIAADRGLAFDLAGDPRRAQQDYARSLRHRDDDEVRRRLALSLAISGERDAALRLIDPQLRRHDRAAWRVQAFVLALTGDSAGAARTAESMMPAGTAQAMAPFLARLASLDPAEKAMAAHLGRFPANGGSRTAAAAPAADPNAVALAMGGPPPVPATVPRQTQTTTTTTRTTAARRRPEADPSDRFGLRGVRRGSETDRPPAQTQPAAVQQQAPVESRWAAAPPESRPEPARTGPAPAQGSPMQVEIAASEPARIDTAPGFTLTPSAPQSVPPEPQRRSEPLADIAALVETLPQEPASRPAARARTAETRPAAERPAPQSSSASQRAAGERPAAQRPARQRATQPAHPARHWVQVAGGTNRAALPRELARVREAAPEEMRGHNAFVAAAGATNRLLVGPFASAREAQAFVNRLARREVSAFAWTSAAGQERDRLTGR